MHNSTKRSETNMKPTEVFNSFKAYNHLNFTINHPFLMSPYKIRIILQLVHNSIKLWNF